MENQNTAGSLIKREDLIYAAQAMPLKIRETGSAQPKFRLHQLKNLKGYYKQKNV